MAEDELNCMHHWMINGENMGTCIKCGDRRDFAHMQTQKKQETDAARASAIQSAIQRKKANKLW